MIVQFPDGMRTRTGIIGGVDVEETVYPIGSPLMIGCQIRHPLTGLRYKTAMTRLSALTAGGPREAVLLWESLRRDALDSLNAKLTWIAKRN